MCCDISVHLNDNFSLVFCHTAGFWHHSIPPYLQTSTFLNSCTDYCSIYNLLPLVYLLFILHSITLCNFSMLHYIVSLSVCYITTRLQLLFSCQKLVLPLITFSLFASRFNLLNWSHTTCISHENLNFRPFIDPEKLCLQKNLRH